MSATASAASTEPPLKKIKVEHTSEGPSIGERGEVMVDEAAAGEGDDGAILAAVSAGAIALNAAARSRLVSVKTEEGIEATEADLTANQPEPVLSLDDQAESDAVLAACTAGATVLNAAARASEVTVKVEKGTEAAEAELARPVLSVDDRVEIFWDGEGNFYAGTVVEVEGGRVKVLYDDGDEGGYDMEREVWRLEGDGAGDEDEEEEDEEEGSDEGGEKDGGIEDEGKGEKEEDRGGRAKKTQAVGSWHRCGVGGCDFKSKQSGNLKKHKANIHDVDVKWFMCDQCEYKSKQSVTLKQHKANMHGIDVKWVKCDQCNYKCKVVASLKKHKAAVHDVDVQWFKCDQCEYKCKENSSLKVHKANIHNIDVKWFKCDECVYKCKKNSHLKQHKANVHGIHVKWFKCDKCEYKCKENGSLKVHKSRHHGSPAPPAPPAL